MATRRGRRTCRACGARVDGRAELCKACDRLRTAGTDPSRRVAERVRDRLSGDPSGGFVCPFCRRELSWETVLFQEAEITIYVREKIYYCPGCRAVLGVSSWHTEG